MIRVGIIGMGFMGRMHFGTYRKLPDQASIVAIADIDPQRAKGDLSTVWGNLGNASSTQLDMTGVQGMTDYRQMLAMPDVDLIDICVPTTVHPAVVAAALAAGKHVLCEKPLARNRKDAAIITQAVARARGYFMPAMCMRFWPQWAWLKKAVQEGRYGRVLSAQFQRVGPCPPGWYQDGVESGGAALDLHIHDTDFVRYCFGEPRAVTSCGYGLHSSAVDYLLTQYHYDDIPSVSAEGGWMTAGAFDFRMRYSVNFERATADFDLARPTPLLLMQDGKSEPINCGDSNGWTEEIRYFLSCIANQTPPSAVTAEDGARSVALIEAEVASVMSGGARIEFVP
jgi:predicted dehydrogenase